MQINVKHTDTQSQSRHSCLGETMFQRNNVFIIVVVVVVVMCTSFIVKHNFRSIDGQNVQKFRAMTDNSQQSLLRACVSVSTTEIFSLYLLYDDHTQCKVIKIYLFQSVAFHEHHIFEGLYYFFFVIFKRQ